MTDTKDGGNVSGGSSFSTGGNANLQNHFGEEFGLMRQSGAHALGSAAWAAAGDQCALWLPWSCAMGQPQRFHSSAGHL